MKIVFREDINLENSLQQLNTNKVNNATFNSTVNGIETKISNLTATVATDLKTAKTYASTLVDNLKANEIKALTTAIDTLNGDKTVKGSVDKKISDAIAAIVDGAPEEYDTFKELLQLIKKDGTDLSALIKQINDKIAAYVGNASDNYNTLEKIEARIKETKQQLSDSTVALKTAITDVANEMPVYQFDTFLPISKDNKIKLSHPAIGNLPYRSRVEIATTQEDKNGNIIQAIIEGYYTVTYDTKTNDGVTYIINSDKDLSSYKANVEYNAKAGSLGK